MIDRFALSFLCIELDRNVRTEVTLVYILLRKNIGFARYQFWDRNQNASEPIDQWVTDLRSKAAKCEFGTFESDMIRDKVVFGVRDDRIKERLLREA